MIELYTIYIAGVAFAFIIYGFFALIILGVRACSGITRYAKLGYTDSIENSWWIFDLDKGNHPVGLAIDIVIYIVLVAIASLMWMFTAIPTAIAIAGKIRRAQFLKAEEAKRVMERLADNR